MADGFKHSLDSVFIYAVFVPHKDKNKAEIPKETVKKCIMVIKRRMALDTAGPRGVTSMQIRTRARTSQYGSESTTLMLGICFKSNLEAMDAFFMEIGEIVVTQLNQTAALIVRWTDPDVKGLLVKRVSQMGNV